MSTFTPKPVEFKFGEYINKGFELFKKDMGTFILAFLFVLIMNFIPFCGFLAIGNFLKIARKINHGEQTSATEIFNFDDFIVYLKLFGIVFLGVLAFEIPLILLMPKPEQQELGSSPEFPIGFFIFMIVFMVILFYFILKAYYMLGLIALENVKSIKEAWRISNIMTKDNLLIIFGFSFVVGLIAMIGYIACFIGLFISAPLTYVIQYISYEDGIQQIKVDELEEIGKPTE